MSNYSKDRLKTRCCERVAHVLKGHYEEGSGVHSRIFEVLVADEYVISGESISGKEYREHVVPCALIRDEALKMYENGAGLADVAHAIENHLKIILITNVERQYMDYELGLLTKMPFGWVFGEDDIYARLHEANIKFKEYSL